MLVDYISNLEHAEELLDEFEKVVLENFFKDGKSNDNTMPNYCWSSLYRSFFAKAKACVQLCVMLKLEVLGIYENKILTSLASLEIPRAITKLEDFEVHFRYIRTRFSLAKEDISNFCSAFDDEEKKRLNEAIHNHFEGCNYSCVAMSVSAAESRLLKLMCLASPQLELELEKKTLGQLIYEYVHNKEKYKNIVPEKHKPLLDLCNTYRTFSVHPKKQRITPRLARSILDLAIEFLTDQDTKPEVVKAQLTA